ncbi:MAG: hypothetical protein ACYTAN_01810 [Planctomycetota bacterium]|jgi:hypothetical protein
MLRTTVAGGGLGGAGVVGYWLAKAFIPPEFGYLAGEEATSAREAIAGFCGVVAGGGVGLAVGILRRYVKIDTVAKLALFAALVVAAGCTNLEHLEREYNAQGALTWEWKTEGSTFLGMKSVEYVIDRESEAAQLAGSGISNNFRDVALRAIEISPVLAERIVAALRPGGQLEAALAEVTKTDPSLAEALGAAAARLTERQAAALARKAAAKLPAEGVEPAP